MQYKEIEPELKLAEKPVSDVVKKTELKLSGEELTAKVKESIIEISGDEEASVELKSVPMQEDQKVYEGVAKARDGRRVKYFAVVVNRESVCDICHAIQFIYIFDEKGEVVRFEPIHLTKYGNKMWSEEDIEKMRRRVVGRSILQPLSFDPEVDAVTSATITSAVIFQALSKGREVFRFVIK
jgi:hypothetical protein